MKRPNHSTFLVTLMVVLVVLSSSACRKQHVVLVCGDVAESGFTEFWCDTARMYATFVSRGIEPQNIHVLYGDGTDWTCPNNPAHNFTPAITDFAATTSDLSLVFNGLAVGDAAHGIEKAGPNDTMIVWTFDHGIPGHLCLRDGDMSTATFQNLVNQINCAKKVFFMQQCFSGDFVAPLTTGNTNTAILTAAGHHVAWPANDAWENNDPCRTGEFNYYLMNSLATVSPGGVALAIFDQDSDTRICARECRDAVFPGDGKPSGTLDETQGMDTSSTPQYADSSGGTVGGVGLTGS